MNSLQTRQLRHCEAVRCALKGAHLGPNLCKLAREELPAPAEALAIAVEPLSYETAAK